MIKMMNIVFDELVFLCYKSENTLGNSNEFEAYIRNGHSNYNSWLVLKSDATRETLRVLLNYNYANRSQTMFIENSCEVGIEKIQRGYLTEYIGTVKNCGYHNAVNEYFVVGLRVNNTEQIVSIASRHLKSTEIMHEEYLKYVDTYRGKENDMCYAFLNHQAMEEDGVTVESIRFELWVNEQDAYTGDAIAGVRIWKFNIL